MGDTSIEWTDKTWNPVTGCSKVSQGCKNCYAERVFPRAYGTERKFTDVVCHEDRLDAPLHWRKPCRVFVNSMSDLFHEKVPFEFIDKVFAVMALCPQHTFQVLTKRPERMLEYLGTRTAFPDEVGTVEEYRIQAWGSGAGTLLDGPWEERPWLGGGPLRSKIEHFIAASLGLDENGDMLWEDEIPFPLPNVWLGVSVEDADTALARIGILKQVPAAVRFVSYEPALADLGNLESLLGCPCGDYKKDHLNGVGRCRMPNDLTHGYEPCNRYCGVDWLIVGGESGPQSRPFHIQWARDVIAQCKRAGVSCFVKQLGAFPCELHHKPNPEKWEYNANTKLRFVDRKGGDMSEWPEDLRVREYPSVISRQ